MSDLKEMVMDVAASLWREPATLEQLSERMGKSEWAMWQLIKSGKSRGWLYCKGEVWHTYKKTVKDVLNPAGYGIDLSGDYVSEFRKLYYKIYGKG